MVDYCCWPRMQDDVEKFVRECVLCDAYKPLYKVQYQAGALSAHSLFAIVSLDCIGPRTYNARKYHILVIVDHYSRFTVAVLTFAVTAATTIMGIKFDGGF